MANYTLKVPLSSESESKVKFIEKTLKDQKLENTEVESKLKDAISENYAEIVIKELEDRALFTMVQKAMQNDELQGVEIMLNGLRVSGDPVSKITASLYALRSATKTLLPLLSVADGELKKN